MPGRLPAGAPNMYKLLTPLPVVAACQIGPTWLNGCHLSNCKGTCWAAATAAAFAAGALLGALRWNWATAEGDNRQTALRKGQEAPDSAYATGKSEENNQRQRAAQERNVTG